MHTSVRLTEGPIHKFLTYSPKRGTGLFRFVVASDAIANCASGAKSVFYDYLVVLERYRSLVIY